MLEAKGRSLCWGLLVVMASVATQALAAEAGAIQGSFQVSETGAATYAVPLQVPPGVSQLVPNLSLAYSSQGGNGLLGIGWSLEGLSAVVRCPRTVAQDGTRGTVDFTFNDRYCLDGQRLVATSGSYGGHQTEYRTERDTFSRVISYSASGNGPSFFRIWTKSGLVMEYGGTTDSRIEAQGKPTARAWSLNKVTDINGNELVVTYSEDTPNGDFVPTGIFYAGTGTGAKGSVQFEYEGRSDVVPGYIGNSVIRVTKRLKSIKTRIEGALTKEIRLNYLESGIGLQSRLMSLTECNGTGACLPATTFSWTGGTVSWTTSAMWAGPSPAVPVSDQCLTGDLNGDGRTDMWCYGGAGQWHVALSTGTAWTMLPPWLGPAPAMPITNQCLAGDLNADGKTDMWCYGGSGSWHTALSTGSGWTELPVQYGHAPALPIGNQCLTGDLNGDSRTDMWCHGGGGSWYPALFTGTGWSFVGPWSSHAVGNPVGSQCLTGDLNGDGRTDMWCFDGASLWYPTISTGSGWTHYSGQTAPAPALPVTDRCLTGDLNGDSLTDMWCYGGSGQYWYPAISTGTGWMSTSAPSVAPAVPVGSQCLTSDINGDGRTDMLCYGGAGTGVWHAAFSRGIGWEHASWSGPGPDLPVGRRCMTGDLNGDGKADMWCFAGGSQWHVTIVDPTPNHLLASITTGTGVVTAITYKPLTDQTVYTKDAGGSVATYPNQDIQAPMHVVANVSVSNGITGGTRSTVFTYGGAKVNLEGRGLLGFRWLQSTDVATGLQVRKEFLQAWPFTGSTTKAETRSGPSGTGILLKLVTSNFAQAAGSAVPSIFVYLGQSTEESWDLTGAALPTITTSYQYALSPQYGDPTQVAVSTSDGSAKVTTNEYWPADTAGGRWILGRLKKATVTTSAP